MNDNNNNVLAVNLKENDFIVTEFVAEGAKYCCKAQVKQYIPDWSDFDNGYHEQPVIECKHIINADGSIEYDDMFLGAGDNVIIRYMTSDEIIKFKENSNL